MKGTVKLFIIIFLVLVSLSAVVASDDNQTDDSEAVLTCEDSCESQLLADSYDIKGDDFKSIQDVIDSANDGDTICLDGKTFKSKGQTIVVNKSVTIVGGFKDKGNVYATLDGENQSRIMIISADVVLKGITFVNGNASDSGNGHYNANGGAIFVNNNNNLSVVNCAFINNTAVYCGGAIFMNSEALLSCEGCVFNFNHAVGGGAMYGGSVVNCVFNYNSASIGGAMDGGSAVNCVFSNNSAGDDGGAMDGGSAVNCVFNYNSAGDDGGAMMYGSADSCIFIGDDTEGITTVSNPVLRVFNYSSSYNSGERLIFNLTSNSGMPITNRNIAVDIFKDNHDVGSFNCLSGEGLPITLDAGCYVAVCRATDYDINPVNMTLTITKANSKIVTSPITVAYNSGKYLTVTLTDGKNSPVSGAQLSIDLNGVKKFTTDKNGRIKISTNKLAPKTYSIKITFNGNGNYFKSEATVKVTVKKAVSKITAKKKTFKKAKKIKKYTITLKSGKKAIKKVKVTLKVKGKTYKAKTNSKGKATFKIKKLSKTGTFKASIKFKGNKYFKKTTKKVKITVK